MKKLISCIFLLLLTNSIFAYEGSKIRIKIAGNVKSNHYLCVSQLGCINIVAGSKGRSFPITPGGVSYIFLAEGNSYRMYPQTLPKSCDVNVSGNQTLTISGSVSKKANSINQLNCRVS